MTALFYAVTLGDPIIINSILDKGANINFIAKNKLNASFYFSDPNTLKILIERGININYIAKMNDLNTTILKRCINLNLENAVQVILESCKKNNINLDVTHCLGDAVSLDNHNIVKLLLDYGVNVNYRYKYGYNVMYFAKSKKMMEILYEHGISLNVYDNHLHTILSYFISNYSSHRNNDHGMMYLDFLLDQKSKGKFKINRYNQHFYTSALQNLIGNFNISTTYIVRVVEDLIDLGYNINVVDMNGRNILHYTRVPDIITLFVQKGIDINAADFDGNTPLLYFLINIYHDNIITINILKSYISNGANPRIRNHLGQNALDIVSSYDNAYLIDIYKIIQDFFTKS